MRFSKPILAFFLVCAGAEISAAFPLSPAHDASLNAQCPPEALVAVLYKQAETKSPFAESDDRALLDGYLAKPLADLVWKDAKETKSSGEVGAIDFDPLYDAQDFEIKNFVIHPAKVDDAKATVSVTFVNLGDKLDLLFSLVLTKDGWRISDIAYPKDGTLLGLLKETYGQ